MTDRYNPQGAGPPRRARRMGMARILPVLILPALLSAPSAGTAEQGTGFTFKRVTVGAAAPGTRRITVQIDPDEQQPLTLEHLEDTDQRRYGKTMLWFWSYKARIEDDDGRPEAT